MKIDYSKLETFKIEVPAIGQKFSGENYRSNRHSFSHPALTNRRSPMYSCDMHGISPKSSPAGIMKIAAGNEDGPMTTRLDRIASTLNPNIMRNYLSDAYVRKVKTEINEAQAWVHPLQAEICLAILEKDHQAELRGLGSEDPPDDLTDDNLEMISHYTRWWYFPIINVSGTPNILHSVRDRGDWNCFISKGLDPGYEYGSSEDGLGFILVPQ
jgi:hypothetical protein